MSVEDNRLPNVVDNNYTTRHNSNDNIRPAPSHNITPLLELAGPQASLLQEFLLLHLPLFGRFASTLLLPGDPHLSLIDICIPRVPSHARSALRSLDSARESNLAT